MQAGFYTVVQFCPERFRREGTNVGVALWANDGLHARFVETHDRIRRMFPGFRVDAARLKATEQALRHRLSTITTEAELVRFISMELSQHVLFLPLRTVIVDVQDVEKTLTRLFKKFVEDPYLEETP